jgi:LPS-assembly protein
MVSGALYAQTTPPASVALPPGAGASSPALPKQDEEQAVPTIVEAQELRGRPDAETIAEGDAELLRGNVRIRADRLTYDQQTGLATARGNVRVQRDGDLFTGPEAQLKVNEFEGFFLNPSYSIGRVGASGTAERFDFINEQRAVATGATYSTCPPDGSGDPDWLISTRSVKLDYEANEGIAEGAVLRFLGVPILALPVLSFPLTDERKSGWLPPTFDIDSRSGLHVSVPYYWNIAPDRDATLTPQLIARRGAALDTQFRYLEPRHNGTVALNLLPNDRLADRHRYALRVSQEAQLPLNTDMSLRLLRVSDNQYWEDFSGSIDSLTPRLLMSDLQASTPMADWTTYARVQRWQVLQDTTDAESVIDTPYQREPQLGARTLRQLGSGIELAFESEYNRFTNPAGTLDAARLTGSRVHAVGALSRTWASPGWSITPKLSFNAASYSLDSAITSGPYAGRRNAARVIPTVSLDSSWVLERDSNWFGRDMRQTLEPRVVYAHTSYRDQTGLPNFDSAAKDFNFESIYSENAFSGVDRVSDAHQLTAGVTTRLLDPATGAEALRLGLVQRYLFRDQYVTPDGIVATRRLSDVLLLGSTSIIPHWTLDASLQYNPDISRAVRSLMGVRYSPGPFRTISATYRFARGSSEQLELGWQWPLYGPATSSSKPLITAARSSGDTCVGSWYSVGRIDYNTRDSRVIDSLLGFEYDAGCWIGRVVARRTSTSRNEAVTGLSVQLELVGLSRLAFGANPLRVLKDNIVGYRALRDENTRSVIPNTYD